MMSRHFRLSSELTGAIAKRLPHAKNQHSAPSRFFYQFVTDIYIYIHCLNKSIRTPHNPHTNSYNTDLFSKSRYLIGKRYA